MLSLTAFIINTVLTVIFTLFLGGVSLALVFLFTGGSVILTIIFAILLIILAVACAIVELPDIKRKFQNRKSKLA